MKSFRPTLLTLVFALGASSAFVVVAQQGSVAVVNGKPIPEFYLQEVIKQFSGGAQVSDPQAVRAGTLEDLIERSIASQEAERLGLHQRPEISSQLEYTRQFTLVQALRAEVTAKLVITDADLLAEYANYKAARSRETEYDFWQVFADREEDANAIIARYKAGHDFEKTVAPALKEHKLRGGRHPWVTPSKFVSEMREMLLPLKRGEVSPKAMETPFGFLLIKVNEVRPANVKSLDEVKQQLTEEIQNKRLKAYFDDLRRKSRVEK